jgi:hypothetical protein
MIGIMFSTSMFRNPVRQLRTVSWRRCLLANTRGLRLAAFLLSLSNGHNLEALECRYQGAGDIRCRVFPSEANHSPAADRRYQFLFVVSNQCWQIRIIPKEKSDISYFDASCDGTNTYIVTEIEQAAFRLKFKDEHDRSRNTNMIACVYPTDMPPAQFEPYVAIWLAYCSGRHFEGQRTPLIRPLWPNSDPAVNSLPLFRTVCFRLLPTTPPMLESCVQYSDGAEYATDSGTVDRVVEVRRYSGSFSNGFPRFAHQVLNTTNVLGTSFPSEFFCKVFLPQKEGRSSNDVWTVMQYDGHLTSVTTDVPQIAIGGGIKMRASVADFRTLKLHPPIKLVSYRNAADGWLSMSPGWPPYQAYRRAIQMVPRPADRPSATRLTAMVVLGIFVAALPLFFVLQKLKSVRQTTSK